LKNLGIPLWLIIVGSILFFLIGQIEAPIVAHLWLNPWPEFRDVMSNSFYEGGPMGVSDIGVTIAIICFFLWLPRRKKNQTSEILSRENLKFIWQTALLTACISVHSLKWLIGRARPKVFFGEHLINQLTVDSLKQLRLPGFMPIFGPRGLSLNSFPSGHTASCAILLVFCYILWPKNKSLSVLLGAAVITLSCAMGAARSMAGMHWLSDSVASIFLTWPIIHVYYSKLPVHKP